MTHPRVVCLKVDIVSYTCGMWHQHRTKRLRHRKDVLRERRSVQVLRARTTSPRETTTPRTSDRTHARANAGFEQHSLSERMSLSGMFECVCMMHVV